MAQMEKPTQAMEEPAKVASPSPKAVEEPVKTSPSKIAGNTTAASDVTDSPKVKNVVTDGGKDGDESRSAPHSPGVAKEKDLNAAAVEKSPRNVKAEAFAAARSTRVEAEAAAWLQAEIRKAEAHAVHLQTIAEQQRMKEEAKAVEARKKEEQRAELLLHNTEVKVDKVMAQAKEKALSIRALATEESEKQIAEAMKKSERKKAEIEETKKRQVAELEDKLQQYVAVGDFPAGELKGFGRKVKESLTCGAS